MCKAHSKVTHIKQQQYFHHRDHLKGRGYNKNSVLYPGRFRWWMYFCLFICVTLLWALHVVIKQQFFFTFIESFMGYDFTGGRIFDFPIDLSYNSAALMRCLWYPHQILWEDASRRRRGDHVTKSRNRKLIRVTSSNEGLKHMCVDLSDYHRYLNHI